MPIITDISPQKRKPNYYNIFVDGKFGFSLGDLELSASALSIGKEIAQADIDDLIKKSEYSKAYNRAIAYISIRPRSVWEVQNYLFSKQYSRPTIEAVEQKLISLELLDDDKFARIWVENRNLIKPRSAQKLRQELAQKRIPKDIIDEALAEISYEDQLKNILAVIQKQQKNPRYADQKKLTEYLLSQGFSYSLVKDGLELSMDQNKS